ncbi:VIT1/CCC1 transporter family protein [Hoyosella sp. G463]|uniref:VIT1/CCC1 transporter family protein n=1 Tax=Lolliginicoccus lacisalsi TaxID=2742202 RepID=A0A927JEB1_9ACTN|nr:VIT1/CCC1 family protein [Lolliginicoccus lacisalsi]MBD8507689.1 VIT1/CCC1 transporter family protein [Lolliginicoccus lacisalsi]
MADDPRSTRPSVPATERAAPTPRDIRRWRRYLANERAEAAVYMDLAERRTGEEREILLALAHAEGRHEAHWRRLLGDHVGMPLRGDIRTRMLGFLARRFGSVFVLALVQRAEKRSPYASDTDATSAMTADEHIHEEVVRALATRGRNRLSGTFRAAVFGANDGLVSNLALILGFAGSGVGNDVILLAGAAGLLAGAMSMAAGEYISVRSQRGLLEASTPSPHTREAVPDLDVNENELALVYRARGMSPAEAEQRATDVLAGLRTDDPDGQPGADSHVTVGTAVRAALASFGFFASGAIIPVVPYALGIEGFAALITACVLVGIALIATGVVVGLLSGGPPAKRGLRQLGIGYSAAAVTYLLGLAFGTTIG